MIALIKPEISGSIQVKVILKLQRLEGWFNFFFLIPIGIKDGSQSYLNLILVSED